MSNNCASSDKDDSPSKEEDKENPELERDFVEEDDAAQEIAGIMLTLNIHIFYRKTENRKRRNINCHCYN